MIAMVYKVDGAGRDLGTGHVSPHYQHFGNFMRHWMQKFPPGVYRAYCYSQRPRRWREADAIKIITIKAKDAI